MLNAFRHHGLYRPERQRIRPDRRCAQRLSASRIVSAPARVAGQLHGAGVLNAFRHHGLYRIYLILAHGDRCVLCSTPFGITDCIGRRRKRNEVRTAPVLNAFRHHGLYRSQYLGGLPLPLGCSTPFGITDCIGRADRRAHQPGVQVLNAFRHHGLYRPWSRGRCRSRCVLNAFRHHGLYRRRRRRHRHSCSLAVLNAFRHHGLYRLGVDVVAEPFGLCSTPFGITDCIGSPVGIGAGPGAGCSTPFGITDCIGRVMAHR